MEENIGIFNKGSIAPSKPVEAPAFPVTLVSKNSHGKWFTFGFCTAIVLFIVITYSVKKQVVVVEVTGKSQDYQEMKFK